MSTRQRLRLVGALVLVVAGMGIASAAPQESTAKLRVKEDGVSGMWTVVLRADAAGQLGTSSKAGTLAAELAAKYGGTVEAVYSHVLNGFRIRMSESEARLLSQDDVVDHVSQVGWVRSAGTQSNAPWGLDRINQRSLPLNGIYTYSNRGAGIHVYVIDSGIRTSHSQFGGRASNDVDLIGGDGNDCNGHGTEVASIIGGSTYGVAKSARLHSVRILNCNAQLGNPDILADALEWVASNYEAPAVVNVSASGAYDADINQAVADVWGYGIPVVVSAGNGNHSASQDSPASASIAITVAATDESDARWYESSIFASNYGSAVDLFAPGHDIPAASYASDTATTTATATSAAAPHVTGVVALYMENRPGQTPVAIRSALVSKASSGKVSDTQGSPNRLLYSGFVSLDVLEPDEHLHGGEQVDSLNGNYHLCYQGDGNLVLYDSAWQALWASNTAGTSTGMVIMQSDGNLVMYDAGGVVRFASNTDGHAGARLIVEGTGAAKIVDANGDVWWSVS